MTGDQIVEYARREHFRVVVTEQMVAEAIARLPSPFTCRDVVEAISRDERGCLVSQYLVALWIDDFVRRYRLRWTGAERPRTYATVP